MADDAFHQIALQWLENVYKLSLWKKRSKNTVTRVFILICLRSLKGIAHPKIKILSLITHPHVVPNLLVGVRVLLCVSSVPASCVHIWFVSCPCFMLLWVKYVPAVFMWLCVNYPVYLVAVFWVWFRLVYSLLPGVSCLWVLPWCPH